MLFNISYTTLNFICFVFVTMLVYFLFPAKKYKWTVLLAAGLWYLREWQRPEFYKCEACGLEYTCEDEEEQEKVHLFEVEVPEGSLQMRDLSVYDAAYDALNDDQDADAAIELARKYFSGGHGDEPNWEYLSAGDAVAVKDVSYFLREQK